MSRRIKRHTHTVARPSQAGPASLTCNIAHTHTHTHAAAGGLTEAIDAVWQAELLHGSRSDFQKED